MDTFSTTDLNWFRGRLADRRLSQRQLARLMNLDPSAVSLMLRGKRRASAQEVADISSLLGVSADEVVLRLGSSPTLPARRRDGVAPPAKETAAVPLSTAQPDVSMLDLPVPMADGSVARLVLPRAMGKDDALRIAAVVQALAVP